MRAQTRRQLRKAAFLLAYYTCVIVGLGLFLVLFINSATAERLGMNIESVVYFISLFVCFFATAASFIQIRSG